MLTVFLLPWILPTLYTLLIHEPRQYDNPLTLLILNRTIGHLFYGMLPYRLHVVFWLCLCPNMRWMTLELQPRHQAWFGNPNGFAVCKVELHVCNSLTVMNRQYVHSFHPHVRRCWMIWTWKWRLGRRWPWLAPVGVARAPWFSCCRGSTTLIEERWAV